MRSGTSWLYLSLVFFVVLAGVLWLGGTRMASVAEAGRGPIPAPVADEHVAASRSETAVFAGGCFWGTQDFFGDTTEFCRRASATRAATCPTLPTAITAHTPKEPR